MTLTATKVPTALSLAAFTSGTIRARPNCRGGVHGGALPIRWACPETPARSPGAPPHTDQSDCPATENGVSPTALPTHSQQLSVHTGLLTVL